MNFVLHLVILFVKTHYLYDYLPLSVGKRSGGKRAWRRFVYEEGVPVHRDTPRSMVMAEPTWYSLSERAPILDDRAKTW